MLNRTLDDETCVQRPHFKDISQFPHSAKAQLHILQVSCNQASNLLIHHNYGENNRLRLENVTGWPVLKIDAVRILFGLGEPPIDASTMPKQERQSEPPIDASLKPDLYFISHAFAGNFTVPDEIIKGKTCRSRADCQ